MKILINTPKVTIPAGVSNHYLGLKPYFSENVRYNEYIPLSHLNIKFKAFYLLFGIFLKTFDMLKFVSIIIINQYKTILLNPSFGKSALKRDAIFLKIAKLLGCKVAVFMHGWDKNYLNDVINNKESFSNAWLKADAYFVLASEFKNFLIDLGVKAPIHLTSTKVNDKLIEGHNVKIITKITSILFLARIEKAKGIFTTIDTFELLLKKYPFLNLNVIGSGKSFEEAKQYSINKNIKNILFTGPLSGDKLKEQFVKADLYMLPTTHGEGMPTSVLEAMAFGLPIISRPVGGLVDFFENDKMGYMIESLDAKDYADKIEYLINNIEKTNDISKRNMEYARENFMASKIAPWLEQKLNKI